MLKKIVLIIIFMSSIFMPLAYAKPATDGVQWQVYSSAIFIDAMKSDKRILLYVKASWCEWCKKTDRQTFHDKSVMDLISKFYIPVVLDVDKNTDEVSAYKVSELPTIFILDKDNKILNELHGYIASDKMIETLIQFSGAPQEKNAPVKK